ncbi:hypothetical protein ACHAXS_006633 [Conticribra weissflogii]
MSPRLSFLSWFFCKILSHINPFLPAKSSFLLVASVFLQIFKILLFRRISPSP